MIDGEPRKIKQAKTTLETAPRKSSSIQTLKHVLKYLIILARSA